MNLLKLYKWNAKRNLQDRLTVNQIAAATRFSSGMGLLRAIHAECAPQLAAIHARHDMIDHIGSISGGFIGKDNP